jgi:chemotaxis protein CheX
MTTASATLSDEQIVEITREVWASFLGDEEQAHLELVPVVDPETAGVTVTGCVTVSGGWKGSVLLSCAEELATKAAAEMFMADADALTNDEIADAVGELANMVGGTIKAAMPGPSQLSIPTVATGSAYHVHVPGMNLASRVSLMWRGECLTISVWEG